MQARQISSLQALEPVLYLFRFLGKRNCSSLEQSEVRNYRKLYLILLLLAWVAFDILKEGGNTIGLLYNKSA